MRKIIGAISFVVVALAAGVGRAAPSRPEGAYVAVFVDDDPGAAGEGRGGSKQRVEARITIRWERDKPRATWAVAPVGTLADGGSELNDVSIVGDRFSAAPIAVKTASQYYLPRSFEGRFLTPDVLLVEGKRYERAARPKR